MTSTTLLVRARSLTGFAQLVSQHGGDPHALLTSVGVAPAVLDEPELSFPLVHFAELLDLAAQTLNLPDFGTRLASGQDVSVLGPVALIARHASSVVDALHSIIRYMPYHSPGMNIRLQQHADHDEIYLSYDPCVQGGGLRQLTELSYSVGLACVRMISQQSGHDWQLSFQHSASLKPGRYRKLFGCQVHWNQPESLLRFPRAVLQTPIDEANSELREASERTVRNLIRRHPLDLGRQVETLLERQLTTGNCTLPVLAKQLGMPPYKLQRCLHSQNLQFEQIIDNLRRNRVQALLAQGQIPLTEVAYLLGYGDPSSLTRSCHRWFGQSPKVLRQKLLQ